MSYQVWLQSHGISTTERGFERMRRYGEIRMVERVSYDGWELMEDLLGLLMCVGSMIFLFFLAGGM